MTLQIKSELVAPVGHWDAACFRKAFKLTSREFNALARKMEDSGGASKGKWCPDRAFELLVELRSQTR